MTTTTERAQTRSDTPDVYPTGGRRRTRTRARLRHSERHTERTVRARSRQRAYPAAQDTA